MERGEREILSGKGEKFTRENSRRRSRETWIQVLHCGTFGEPVVEGAPIS
jgi:hypothetical protein